jgi:hypothetical protein
MPIKIARRNSSGQTLIILLLAVLIVVLLSVFVMNKIYFKQSEEMKKNGLDENDVINQPTILPNAQNQVDAVRNRMNEIQKDYNKKLNGPALNQ